MKRKTIALPGMHDLDIGPILPIVDTPIFQRLRYRKQLENATQIFVDANHTRFAHSLGTYSLTLERAANWQRDGVVDADGAWDLALCGLLHDVGHGPYSHAIEALTGLSHHDVGLRLLDPLADALTACGSDVARIRALFTGQNPLAVGVAHRPLGTDKIDYLVRDARNTIETLGIRVGDLLNHVYFRDSRLVIDRVIMPEAMVAQSVYVYMHDRVYLRRSVLIAKRFFQKIVAYEMSHNAALVPERLWEMDDLALESTLLGSQDKLVRDMFAQLRQRRLPKMAIRLVPKGVATADRVDGKPFATHEVEPHVLARFDCFQRPSRASELEEAVARCAELGREEVLVIPVVTPERFIPDDVPVYDGSTYLGSLQELCPSHFQHLSEVAKGYAALRVCVPQEHRKRVAAPQMADRIIDLLMETTERCV